MCFQTNMEVNLALSFRFPFNTMPKRVGLPCASERVLPASALKHGIPFQGAFTSRWQKCLRHLRCKTGAIDVVSHPVYVP